jgi:hypothetical protein
VVDDRAPFDAPADECRSSAAWRRRALSVTGLRAERQRRLGVGDGPFDLAAPAWYVTGRTAQAPR